MDLQVRSQDREILRINPELEIYEYGNGKFLVIDTKGHTNYDKAKILGEYKTKERTLEVLDEIQNRMLKGSFAKKVNGLGEELDLITNNLLIYEMPKEQENK